jgi:hypothetical protein
MAMRMTTLAALAIMPLLSGAAQSQAIYNGPWCAIVMIGEGSIAERCDMRSFEMCQQEIRGQGASHCTQNPRYRGPVEPQRKKQRLH